MTASTDHDPTEASQSRGDAAEPSSAEQAPPAEARPVGVVTVAEDLDHQGAVAGERILGDPDPHHLGTTAATEVLRIG